MISARPVCTVRLRTKDPAPVSPSLFFFAAPKTGGGRRFFVENSAPARPFEATEQQMAGENAIMIKEFVANRKKHGIHPDWLSLPADQLFVGQKWTAASKPKKQIELDSLRRIDVLLCRRERTFCGCSSIQKILAAIEGGKKEKSKRIIYYLYIVIH